MQDYELSQTADQIQAAITKAAKLPSVSSEDSGKVLTVNSLGTISAQTPSGGGSTLKVKTTTIVELIYNLQTDLPALLAAISATSNTHYKLAINTLGLDHTYDEIHVDLSALTQFGVSIYNGDMIFKKCMQSSNGSANQWVCSFTIYGMGDTIINKNTFYISVIDGSTYGAMAAIHEYLS